MSASTYAYAWKGHILTSSEDWNPSDQSDNVVPVPLEIWERLLEDRDNCELPSELRAEKLGLLSSDDTYFLACGTAFHEAYTNYGSIYPSPDEPLARDEDAEYHQAMKYSYNLTLPPSQTMFGCSTER